MAAPLRGCFLVLSATSQEARSFAVAARLIRQRVAVAEVRPEVEQGPAYPLAEGELLPIFGRYRR